MKEHSRAKIDYEIGRWVNQREDFIYGKKVVLEVQDIEAVEGCYNVFGISVGGDIPKGTLVVAHIRGLDRSLLTRLILKTSNSNPHPSMGPDNTDLFLSEKRIIKSTILARQHREGGIYYDLDIAIL